MKCSAHDFTSAPVKDAEHTSATRCIPASDSNIQRQFAVSKILRRT